MPCFEISLTVAVYIIISHLQVCLVAIVYCDAQRPRTPRKEPRPRAIQNRQRSRTLLEATLSRFQKIRIDNDQRKIKIKLPKFTLKKIQTHKRRRGQRRPHRRPGGQKGRPQGPRLNRDVPQQNPEPEVVYVEEIESPEQPPPTPPEPQATPQRYPQPTTTIAPKRVTGELVYQSEPEPLKIFKFEPSDAKPVTYTKTFPAEPNPAEIRVQPEGEEAPTYFKSFEPTTEIIYQGEQIFPDDVTNSISEFSSVAATDGKFLFKNKFLYTFDAIS